MAVAIMQACDTECIAVRIGYAFNIDLVIMIYYHEVPKIWNRTQPIATDQSSCMQAVLF